jgi:hypothetical protein
VGDITLGDAGLRFFAIKAEDRAAFCSESGCYCFSDALSGSENDDRLTLQVQIHI